MGRKLRIDLPGWSFAEGQRVELQVRAELGGTVPAVGDMILDPGARVRSDRFDPAEREAHEVVQRWFYPGSGRHVASLVIKSRTMTPAEVELIPS
jgi:hypothetical protein